MRILLISPFYTHPSRSGAQTRLRTLSETLKKQMHDVGLVCLAPVPFQDRATMKEVWGKRYFSAPLPSQKFIGKVRIALMQRLGFNPHQCVDYLYHPKIQKQLEIIRDEFRPEAVIVNYIFFSRILEIFPKKVLKILDTNDCFSQRLLKMKQHGLHPWKWWLATSDGEALALNRSDRVLAIQKEEAQIFRTMTTKNVFTVGPLFSPRPLLPERQPRRLLFIGHKNEQNIQGIRNFIEHYFPAIRRLNADIKLTVVGSVTRYLRPSTGVELIAHFPQTEALYKECLAAINPLSYGSGMSLKAVEAISFGRPLLASKAGLRGLEANLGQGIFQTNKLSDYLEVIGQLLDEKFYVKQCRAALESATRFHRLQLEELEKGLATE